MPTSILDNTDHVLLGMLQRHFPLARTPFNVMGSKMGVSGEEVIRRIQGLKDKKIVRVISPVLDARKLGYQSALIALKVPEGEIEAARRAIIDHPGISHAYRRNHDFNIWITLSLRQESGIENEVDKIAGLTGAKAIFALPATKVFKLNAYFGRIEDVETGPGTFPGTRPEKIDLSELDRDIINSLQADLALVEEPFSPLAASLKIDVETLISHCQSFLQSGVMRRYGASINHRNAGYRANAMACWAASPEKLEIGGHKLASLPEVSHCYERQTNSFWKYNLFAMIHGRTPEECWKIVDSVSEETGLVDRIVLFSSEELKKTRIRYQV